MIELVAALVQPEEPTGATAGLAAPLPLGADDACVERLLHPGKDFLLGQKRQASIRSSVANRLTTLGIRLDNAHDLKEIMQPCYEPGKFADWIAPPRKGVKGKGVDFEYVKFAS